MFRSVVVIVVVGLLPADPIFCGADAASGPCAPGCQPVHGPFDTHSRPGEHGHDATHGCICQGATQGRDGKLSFTIPIANFNTVPPDSESLIPPLHVDYSRSSNRRFSTATGGRRVRLQRQSLLF